MSAHKIRKEHLERNAPVYIRQSNPGSVINHVASGERQYEMRERAIALGWAADQVYIIDKDQGISGASTYGRQGFKELLSEIIIGKVGAVFCVELSRLARDSNDFQYLFKACSLADTLIIDETTIYDPNNDDDRLVLGMRATLSEVEKRLIRTRLLGAKLLKAKKGKLRLPIPIGYVYDSAGEMMLDPDEEIQKVVRLIFEVFDECGKTSAVLKYFIENNLRFPKRDGGGHNGAVSWGQLSKHRLLYILHNANYAGAYAFGQTKSIESMVSPVLLETRRAPRRVNIKNWTVLIPDHHPGYINWTQYVSIQERLKANSYRFKLGHRGAIRLGAALLQGRIICGKCGRPMYVVYPSSKRNAKAPRYFCRHTQIDSSIRICQSIASSVIDRAVTRQLLTAIAPAQLEMSIETWQQLESQATRVDQQWGLRLERAEFEADLARRRFINVEPENRLVARCLEQAWNERLKELEQLKLEHAEVKLRKPVSIGTEEKTLLFSLAQDFPLIWDAETTTNEQRKMLLRQIITDVTLKKVGSTAHISILWRTQAQTNLEVFLHDRSEVLNLVRNLSPDHTDGQIAKQLNNMGLTNRMGRPFGRGNICALRKKHGIALQCSELQSNYPSGQRGDHLYTVRKAAELLRADQTTIRTWMRRGLLDFVEIGHFKWIKLTPDKINELRRRKGKRLPQNLGTGTHQCPVPPAVAS